MGERRLMMQRLGDDSVDGIRTVVINGIAFVRVSEIDWPALKQQKQVLLQGIDFLEKNQQVERAAALNGILHLIDHLQDAAVDDLGLPEDQVFQLSEEEDT